jgi:hypothetical protein
MISFHSHCLTVSTCPLTPIENQTHYLYVANLFEFCAHVCLLIRLAGLLMSLALLLKHIWIQIKPGGVGCAHTNNSAKASKEHQKTRDHYSIRTEGNSGTSIRAEFFAVDCENREESELLHF